MSSITFSFCEEFSKANQLDEAGPCKAGLIALGKIPMQLITTPIDTLIGTGKILESFVPFAKLQECIVSVLRHLSPLQRVVSNLFRRIIEILNPKFRNDWEYTDNYISPVESLGDIYVKAFSDYKDTKEDFRGFDGLTIGYCLKKVGQLVQHCNCSENSFVKHVGTRFSLLIMAIVAVFCRTIDFTIGVGAAAVSILLLGRGGKRLHHIACKGLAVLSVITDIYMCVLFMIKPLPEFE